MSRRWIYLSTATAAVLGAGLVGVVATFFGYPLPWWSAVLLLAALPLLWATTAYAGHPTARQRAAIAALARARAAAARGQRR